MRLPNVKIGDVFLLHLPKGYGFLQCVREAEDEDVETVRVLPKIYEDEWQNKMNEIVSIKELFFTQLSVKYAVKKGFVENVGNYHIPKGSEVPRYFKEEHVVRGEFLGWYIIDSVTLKRQLVKELSKEERKLSEDGIMSIPDIIEKIEENWTPESDFLGCL